MSEIMNAVEVTMDVVEDTAEKVIPVVVDAGKEVVTKSISFGTKLRYMAEGAGITAAIYGISKTVWKKIKKAKTEECVDTDQEFEDVFDESIESTEDSSEENAEE